MLLLRRLHSLTPDQFGIAGLVGCAGLLISAYTLEHGFGMEPCPLCILQRLCFLVLGLVFLARVVHRPKSWGRYGYAAAGIACAVTGAMIAVRHLWLQSLPPEKVPACGPGFDYLMDVFPVMEALAVILRGSGECAAVEPVLGLPIPAWTLMGFIVFGLLALQAGRVRA